MKIAIITDVHVGKPLKYRDKVRASSDGVMEIFESFLKELSRNHKPDLIINMGDLIRSENEEADLSRYDTLLGYYKSLGIPVIHLYGNHEIKRMQNSDVEAKWKHHGFDQNGYGLRSFDDIDILWLKIEAEAGHYVLPPEQITWLEKVLGESIKPLLIFVHCPVDDHDVSGNFFYEALDNRKKEALFLKNQSAVRSLICSNPNVIAVFQAHLHYFYVHSLEGIPYITCPAMGDNICAPDIEHTMPEIYTLVTIQKHQFNVKAYSKEYCFAGYQQDFNLVQN